MLLLANNTTKVVCKKLIVEGKCAIFWGTPKFFLAQIPSFFWR